MNTTREGQFEIAPAETRESWERILQGGGAPEDLERVVQFLAHIWRFDGADPRGFDAWLSGQGMEAKRLTPLTMTAQKQLYALTLAARIVPTTELLIAVVNGIHAAQFFGTIGRFSSDFRIFAYGTAVSAYRNEGIVYALAALSQESQWVIDASTGSLKETPVLKVFTTFATLKKTQVCLGLMSDRPTVSCGKLSDVDTLFCLATNPPHAARAELRQLGREAEDRLMHIADNLLNGLPDRGFGQFVKVNLSVFVCAAGSDNRLYDMARDLLVGTEEPAVANFFEWLGPEFVAAELSHVYMTFQPGRERLLAALVDAWRRISDESIGKFEERTNVIDSKAPVVTIALKAGLARRSPRDEERFARLLAKGLQKAGDHAVREWLIRNPEFINHLPVNRASLQIVRTILDAARAVPAQALSVASQLLEERREVTPGEYWEQALRTLAAIGGAEADRIFREFVKRHVHTSEEQYMQDLLAREPAASLLRRNIQPLLQSTAEDTWSSIIALFRCRNPELTLVQLLEALFTAGGRLSEWIVASLIPDLLEEKALSTEFNQSITRIEITAAIARVLAAKTQSYVDEIRGFSEAWTAQRSAIKKRLLSRVQTGLRVAIKASVPDTRLHEQLQKGLLVAEEWAAATPPGIDPVISTIASIEQPAPLSDPNGLRAMFTHRVPTALEFTLTVAQDPWVIDAILGQSGGPWPKAEMLVGQIIHRYVHVVQVRNRSRELLDTIDDAVRTELAMTLRAFIADIEAELAGFFAFRDILDRNGLRPVMGRLGSVVEQRELSSDKHKVMREPGTRGRLRVFGLGISVNDRVVSSGLVMNSGDEDDRD